MNLNQITVPVTDVERSLAFYEKLGLQLIVKALPHYARFQCPQGDATFSLHHAEQLPAGDGIWVYFEIENLDAYVDALIAKGIAVEGPPADTPWLWRECRLKDPDNNQLILYYAGDNRLHPPWRLQ